MSLQRLPGAVRLLQAALSIRRIDAMRHASQPPIPSAPLRARMGRFHRLSIARVDRKTRDPVAIGFDVRTALREVFCFEAGQQPRLRADIVDRTGSG
jgi:hypothetical protein